MKKLSAKKISSVLHLWLGLSSGLVVFTICITGCIYVFEDELQNFFYKERRYVAVPEHAKACIGVDYNSPKHAWARTSSTTN